MIKKLIYIAALFSGLTCFNVAQADGYYQELGGKAGVENIVDNRIESCEINSHGWPPKKVLL